MIRLKGLIQKKYLFIFIVIILLFFLFHTRKVYALSGYDNANTFPENQLFELAENDAVLNMNQTAVLFYKKNQMSFFVFSKENFKTLSITDFVIKYDKKIKKINCDVKYDMDKINPSFDKFLTYNFEGKPINGYYKFIDSDLYDSKKVVWINFYDLFKWQHRHIGAEFPVTIIINYKLDEKEYSQELKYTVTCVKDYPVNWSLFFLGMIFHFDYN